LQKDLELTLSFKDHFSTQSAGYARYRPTYPRALFQFLASLSSGHGRALDCATGSGQAAIALTEFYSEVVASDASQAQIDAAIKHPKVCYTVASAERSGLGEASVDLLTVGQAFHWFDKVAFMREASRVLRPDGVLAIWCYELCSVNDECDAIVDRLYTDIVGEFWPAERVTIEEGYRSVVMPGTAVDVPAIEMTMSWSAADMLGYLRTWSACNRYEKQHGSDPVAEIEEDLAAAWGDPMRPVVWPLAIKVSRPNSLLE